ncbi:MAG TPA: alpha/beta fold hydrolase [Terracidiphilus sp.]|nr:alpha/beta fold hydrolase [Terracidiphilus sp.]
MKVIKRLLWVVAALLVVAGIGFWARPVSYYNGAIYLREFLSGVESSSVQVAGHRVHYLAQGPEGGPAVVLVHGLGGHAEEWLNLSAYLVKAGYRVYIPDLPGYGRSDKPADFSYSVRDEADVVVGFLDALGLKQVDLGGWSMGGGIAQQVALRHPERVRKLMLFASIGLYKAPAFDLRLFTPTTPAELDQLDALLMPNPPKVPGFIARDILRLAKERAWVVHRALDSMRTGQDATDSLLPQLRMPVLIVWGDADRILPLDQGETMHKLVQQSELVVIPGCGHLAPAQCSSQIGPRVVEFVKR